MTSLEGRAHHADISRAVKGIIQTAIRHVNQLLLDALDAYARRVDKVGGAKLATPLLLGIVDVDDNDLAGLVLDRALNDREANTSRSKYGYRRSFLDLGRDRGRAVSGGDTAAQQTGSVRRRLGRDGHDRNVCHDRVLRKSRRPHKVQDILATGLESSRSIRHHTLALGGPDFAAEVGLARFTEFAFPTFRGAISYHVSYVFVLI